MKRWYGFCGIGFSLCVGVGVFGRRGRDWETGYVEGVGGGKGICSGANLFELQH